MHPCVHRSDIYDSQDWKKPKCPTVDEWIKKLLYIYTMEFYVAIKKKELSSFATAWMYLENIMISKISQLEKGEVI